MGSGLKVRFVDSTDVAGLPEGATGALSEQLQRATSASAAPAAFAGFALRSVEDVPLFFRAFPDPTPWFRDWRDALLRTVPPPPHSTVAHPVAVLVAVPVSSPAAVAAELSPSVFRLLRHLDAGIPRFHLAVQCDAGDKADAAARTRLAALQQTHGDRNCCLLQLQTLSDGTGAQLLGRSKVRLQPPDIAELERVVRTLIASAVIPVLHSAINALVQHVQAGRKGLGTRMKNLFRFGSSGGDRSAPATPALSLSPTPGT